MADLLTTEPGMEREPMANEAALADHRRTTTPPGPSRAAAEIAYVAGEIKACRDAGFTEHALHWPRSEAGLVALCAFNGIKPEQAPRGWHYWPNEGMKKCWERVIAALDPTLHP